MTRIFIGVAWPYANGPFHIGHLAGAYLPGDTFARFHRLRGNEVLMVSGSDMHGTPIAVRADQEGTTPQAIAERYDAVHRSCFARLGFSFDLYTNTHTVLHRTTVQETFLSLLENGLLSRKTEDGAFCPKDQRFLPDRYLRGTCPNCGNPSARGDECDRCGRVLEPKELGSPVCSNCSTAAEFRPSEHFYLRLDLLEPKVREFLGQHPEWRPNVRGVAENFLAQGLRATPITRDLDWGVPIPLEGYDGKRIYVWFEAVIGYLSASKEWAIRSGHPGAYRKYWEPDPELRTYYFIGKDNIFHHAILWPAISLGIGGLALASDVPANEWLTVGGGKISKSRPEDADAFLPSLLEHHAPDVIRFYAAAMAPQHHDTEYTAAEFRSMTEDVLANQYGNLVQRLLVLTRDRFGGKTPPEWPEGIREGPVAERIRGAHAKITLEYEKVHLREALDAALAEVREGNRRFHEAKPWQAPPAETARTVVETLWLIRAASTWLAPVIPFSSAQVHRMLGFPEGPTAGHWDHALQPVPAGQTLGEIHPLFPRAEPPTPRPSSAGPGAPSAEVPMELRVGVIRTAEPHPSADRLYALTVDAGDAAPRSVVAGLRPFYTPAELVGRRVVLLANLEPRTIRKVRSEGMLLAADHDGKAILLRPPDGVDPGAVGDGGEKSPGVLKYEEFERHPLVVGRSLGPHGPGSRIEIGGRSIEVDGAWPLGQEVVVRLDAAEATRGRVVAFGGGRPAVPSAPVPPGGKVR
ncbi:MAG TPA: methionine--tRNA ligase [Thermoplasmata archaeon]|nr:methionine--tRNA ligase [Thermoplasmata archaeon]